MIGIAWLCGLSAIFIGVSGLLGWLLDIALLRSIIPGYKPIAISMALVAILLGGVQMLAARPLPLPRGIRLMLLVVTLVITIFGLLEIIYLITGLNLTIEETFLNQYPALSANLDAHISPVAGVLAFLASLAYLLLLLHGMRGGRPGDATAHLIGALGTLVLLSSAFFFLSYIYGTPFLYGSSYIPIAITATVVFMLLGFGIVSLNGSGAFPLNQFAGESTRARLFRAFLPITTLLMLLLSISQYFLTRLTAINPAVVAPILVSLFLLIIGVVISRVARVMGNLIDRAEHGRLQAMEDLRQLNETLEQRVRERTAALEAMNKELEAFSYSVSHDLRAPLRGIDGFSKQLLDKYAGIIDATGQDYLLRVRNAAGRMGHLIDDMLDLSRIGRRSMRIETVDLSDLAAAVILEFRQREPERQVQVEIQPGLQATGDAGLLRIVLENLLGNAWKFTGLKEDARIQVGATVRDHECIYFVRDNGVRFDMSYADKLFTPFQRLHSEEEFPGTGIGLAIVQRIIARHGGRVWAEGQEGVGATIYFTLTKESEME